MYERILIPTDGSEGAENAARHGIAIARAYGAHVDVLHVVDTRAYSSSLADIDALVREQEAHFKEAGEQAVETIRSLAVDVDVSADTRVETGIPHETILDYADDHDIDLIAMGTHGRTGLDRLMVGSIAERVVRTASVPVLTARRGAGAREIEAGPYEEILIPTDGSPAATAAVSHGIDLARRFDATVHALYVVDVSALAGPYDAGPVLTDLLSALEKEGEEATGDIADRAADAGVDVVTSVIEATPYRGIRDYVEEYDIDLVTMGTHGRSGFDRYVLGSVTEKTLRTVEAPVLTVRTHEDAD